MFRADPLHLRFVAYAVDRLQSEDARLAVSRRLSPQLFVHIPVDKLRDAVLAWVLQIVEKDARALAARDGNGIEAKWAGKRALAEHKNLGGPMWELLVDWWNDRSLWRGTR